MVNRVKLGVWVQSVRSRYRRGTVTGERVRLLGAPQSGVVHYRFPMFNLRFATPRLYQGLATTAFAVWAQTTVLRSMPAISTNLMLMMIPVVGLIASALIVDERITPALLAGMVLIFLGVNLNLLGDRRGELASTKATHPEGGP